MVPGILFALVGILLIWVTVKGMSINNMTTYILGGIFLGIGVLVCIFDAIDYGEGAGVIIALGVGIIFIWAGLFNMCKIFKCKMKVNAVYVGSAVYSSNKSKDVYSPEFKYIINDNNYKNTSGECFSKKYIKKKFQTGKTYTIHVNPKNPYEFLTRRRVSLSCINLLVMGMVFICVGIDLIC